MPNLDINGNIKVNGKEVALKDDIPDTSGLVPKTRTINNKALSSNISLGNKDVGALPDYTINISHQSAGNPRIVKFVSVNYSNRATCFKMAAMTCHDNGVSYQFLTDMLIAVTTGGEVTANIYKFAQSSIGNVDGVARYTGDVFYVNDTTNQVVDFYILCGQWSDSQFTPITKVGSTYIGDVTQYSGTATYYSSGEKNWVDGCGTAYARLSDLSSYLPKSGGNMSGSINMGNTDITNVNNIVFADPGVNEGISWGGGNGWKIFESPNDLSNTSGNLQFVTNTDRRMTLDTSGNLDVTGSITEGGTTLSNKYAPKNHSHSSSCYTETEIDARSLDPNTWYPVTIQLDAKRRTQIEIESKYLLAGGQSVPWSSHGSGGFVVHKKWSAIGSGWGTSDVDRQITASTYNWTNSGDPVRGIGQLSNGSVEYVYVRGGGSYLFRISDGIVPVLRTSTYTSNNQSVGPITSAPETFSPSRSSLTVSTLTVTGVLYIS